MPTADQLDAAAEQLGAFNLVLGARATLLTAGVTTVSSTSESIPSWWTGGRADATASELCAFAVKVAPAAEPLHSVAHRALTLSWRASTLAGQRRLLENEQRELRWTQPSTPPFGPSPAGPFAPAPDPRLVRLGEIDRALESIDDAWTTESGAAATAINDLLATCNPAVRADINSTRLGFGSDPFLLELLVSLTAGLHPPDVDRDPAKVHEWWGSLDPNQRAALIATMPGVIGNLDGIPLPDRADSIRRYMNDLLADDGPDGEMADRLRQFIGPDGRIDPNRKIIVFDPTGDGRVAEYFGDFADADNVTVIVPGMGSTLSNFSSGVAKDAERLWTENGPGSSVIAWTGYDAPAGAEQGIRALEVASPSQAKVGGQALHGFLDGIDVQSDAPLTLIGHSYGSLTVGMALSDGAKVTNAVFIGSPGVGVNHVSEFPPGAAEHYYAGEVKGDPVATLQQFGEDPTDPDFGTMVFDAGEGDGLNPIDRHSEYFDDGVAIDNLSAISTGGTPTPGHMTPTEILLEADEDAHDLMNDIIDFGQGVHHVPFVDDHVDSGIDGVQAGVDFGRDKLAVLGETGGHYLEDGAEYVGDRLEDGAEYVGERFEDGVQQIEDGAGWVRDRGEELGDALGAIGIPGF